MTKLVRMTGQDFIQHGISLLTDEEKTAMATNMLEALLSKPKRANSEKTSECGICHKPFKSNGLFMHIHHAHGMKKSTYYNYLNRQKKGAKK